MILLKIVFGIEDGRPRNLFRVFLQREWKLFWVVSGWVSISVQMY